MLGTLIGKMTGIDKAMADIVTELRKNVFKNHGVGQNLSQITIIRKLDYKVILTCLRISFMLSIVHLEFV